MSLDVPPEEIVIAHNYFCGILDPNAISPKPIKKVVEKLVETNMFEVIPRSFQSLYWSNSQGERYPEGNVEKFTLLDLKNIPYYLRYSGFSRKVSTLSHEFSELLYLVIPRYRANLENMEKHAEALWQLHFTDFKRAL
jgi:hypothetical protein